MREQIRSERQRIRELAIEEQETITGGGLTLPATPGGEAVPGFPTVIEPVLQRLLDRLNPHLPTRQ